VPLTGRDGSTPFSRTRNPLQITESELEPSWEGLLRPRLDAVHSRTNFVIGRPFWTVTRPAITALPGAQERQVCARLERFSSCDHKRKVGSWPHP